MDAEGTSTTIGRGTVVRGSVRGDGDLEILGRVEGSVAVSGELSIGEGALVRSDVSGRRVTVRGAVAGNVSAVEAILLEAGARVVGDLGAPQIGIRPGALVRGLVSTRGPLSHEAGATATRARAATPAARPATPARPAPAPAAKPAARPAPAPAPAPRPAARPAPTPSPRRVEAPKPAAEHAAPRAHAEHHAPAAEAHAPHAEPEEAIAAAAEEEPTLMDTTRGGPPPPVVPQIRKGAKASLRRKGAR
jgi:cytoskeletal protein CcmA (bactofilin family)